MKFVNLSRICLFPLATLVVMSTTSWAAGKALAGGNIASLHAYGNSVYWSISPGVEYETVKLTLSPSNGEPIVIETDIDPAAEALDDGDYNYELVTTPSVDPALRAELKAIREAAGGQEARSALKVMKKQGKMKQRSFTQTGFFRILDGQLVSANAAQE